MFPGFKDGKFPGEDIINSWYPILFALVIGLIFGLRNWLRGPQCFSQENAKGKTVIVTGASSGVGLETARELFKRGADVILACRDTNKGKEAVENITKSSQKKRLTVMELDLASFKSIREFAKEVNEKLEKVDILVNNAGIMSHPQAKSQDGLELHWQVNYLGHFLLTQLLLDKLKSSAPSRIINVSGKAYRIGEIDLDDLDYTRRTYKPGDAFAASKLAVMLNTHYLAKELEGSNVTVNAMHPGVVNSDAHRHMGFRQSTLVRYTFAPIMWFLMKTPNDGAQTLVYLAVAKEEDGVSGKYYGDCTAINPEACAKDDEKAKELWEYSMKACGLEEAVTEL